MSNQFVVCGVIHCMCLQLRLSGAIAQELLVEKNCTAMKKTESFHVRARIVIMNVCMSGELGA